jgi:ABC-type dipeptide/oligopeptide/nickel transport system permease component
MTIPQAASCSPLPFMVFLGSIPYIVGLLLTDISYTLFDPRLRS